MTFFAGRYCSLNSGLHPYKAGALPLNPHLQLYKRHFELLINMTRKNKSTSYHD
jgi:hypothetical protein